MMKLVQASARPVGTEETDRARRQPDAEVVHGLNVSEGLRQVTGFDEHGRSSRERSSATRKP